MIIRADQRFRTMHDVSGEITSRHCFSAGAHYEPSRMGVGTLIGFDEHLLAPGAGFAEHAHRGVDIVSWVISGALRHGDGSRSIVVQPGRLLVQRCGDGIRHSESNASDTEALQMIQLTFLSGPGSPSVLVSDSPVDVPGGRLTVVGTRSMPVEPPCFAHVVSGSASLDAIRLSSGDSVVVEQRSILVPDIADVADGRALVCELGGQT